MWSASEMAFFASLPDFTADHTSTAQAECARLSDHRGWAPGGRTYRRNFRRCFGRDDVRSSTLDGGPGGVPLHVAFSRLAMHEGIRTGSEAYRNRQAAFYQERFTHHFGTDASTLECWQALCTEVDISPIPTSITQCKKALKSVHVNLVDLVDRRETGQPAILTKFRNRQVLREYTLENDKIFPKRAAKAEGFIKVLLREIF